MREYKGITKGMVISRLRACMVTARCLLHRYPSDPAVDLVSAYIRDLQALEEFIITDEIHKTTEDIFADVGKKTAILYIEVKKAHANGRLQRLVEDIIEKEGRTAWQ